MNLCIHNRSLFDGAADAAILHIDGAGPGMGGRLAREFARLFPACNSVIEASVPYPLLPGRYHKGIPGEGAPFQSVYLASVLDHLHQAGHASYPQLVRSAYTCIFRDAALSGISSIAAGLPVAGLRSDPLNAFMLLADVMENAGANTRKLTLNLSILEPEVHEMIKRFARSTGWI
jgi:hypothetical protein